MPVAARNSNQRPRSARERRGFLLILVVGMLAVLSIVGISFSEQSRVDLLGAANTRDLGATDGLAESGFEIAMRLLADDASVWSATEPTWDAGAGKGVGFTSRWGFNPHATQSAPLGVLTPAAGAPNNNGPAPNRSPENFLHTWQALTWNEQEFGTNDAYGYDFTFVPGDTRTTFAQRHPVDAKVVSDVWQLQPLARVRKFRVHSGSSFGIIQVGIAPKDGAINLNDVFDPGTITENPGWYETLPAGSDGGIGLANTDARVAYASPDRRTLEYILGRPPEYATRNKEVAVEDDDGSVLQWKSNTIAGNARSDDGVYNFRKAFEPGGAETGANGLYTAWEGTGWMNKPIAANSSATQLYRYNFEGARYPMHMTGFGMSMMFDKVLNERLCVHGGNRWFPSGRFTADPSGDPANFFSPGTVYGTLDACFYGFGFDRFNGRRGGDGTLPNPSMFATIDGDIKYIGAGVYGHPKTYTYQRHFINAAANGRFWTDLTASWYFGGAPGYTSALGAVQGVWYGSTLSNWTHLGSSYDSAGVGTHWMPPTMHVWLPGNWNASQLGPKDTSRGLKRQPANMPPALPAGSYAYPRRMWDDDYNVASAHFTFNDVRSGGVRAFGIQENWGLFGTDNATGRMYDAVNVNVSNFQTIYGLLTPEKLPSMLQRTVVAPHLHWKSRLLDGAYEGMENFTRYDPNAAGVLTPYTPPPAGAMPAPGSRPPGYIPEYPAASAEDALRDNLFGRYTNPGQIYNVVSNPGNKVLPYQATDAVAAVDPVWYRYSVHRHYEPHPTATPGNVPRRLYGKMDFKTAEPAVYTDPATGEVRRGTGQPADDVFTDTHYDVELAPISSDANDTLTQSLQVARPTDAFNWADYFMQRNAVIPAAKQPAKPVDNKWQGLLDYPEGVAPVQTGITANMRTFPNVVWNHKPKPHPVYGLPNPDYMLTAPRSATNFKWTDQFRRYFPVVYKRPDVPDPLPNPAPANCYPCAPRPEDKMMDDATSPINPMIPIAKGTMGSATVPGVSKDEAWRITRVGQKYQDIIANEIMDYQINPWWPNPCVHLTEIAVPLDKRAYISTTRQIDGTLTSPPGSYLENSAAGSYEYQVPDYFAYFNRFWCRAAGKYKRGGDVATTERGELYRPTDNQVENRGIYPQAFQYFGQATLPPAQWRDYIREFPSNTLDDQLGGEWRYLSGVEPAMKEQPNAGDAACMRSSPARNHPFKNWADFVAMLGHLVYRSPMPATSRNVTQGVNAWTVCHGASADPRNTGRFFDGSLVATGSNGTALADSLQGMPAVTYDKAVVARDGWWPISGNHGEFPTPSGPSLYPERVAPWADQAEWERRIDEWRGRDAAGLRIEQHYISEAAANDVLVNLTNGRIGPIDFDGDGHITMTCKDDLAQVYGKDGAGDPKFWKGFPFHNQASNYPGSNVQAPRKPGVDYNTDPDNALYGLRDANNWSTVPAGQIIQGCVTLPIKFRSNTFRVTVLVSLTDASYKNVYSTRRYSKVVSRVPARPSGSIKVHGRYTGQFIQHGTRVMAGVDPDLSWLGAK